jgi:hypothetical protein
VTDFLNTFPGQQTRLSSDIIWPPKNPDLTTPDNSLWGLIKERISGESGKISGQILRNTEELKFAVGMPSETFSCEPHTKYLTETGSKFTCVQKIMASIMTHKQ